MLVLRYPPLQGKTPPNDLSKKTYACLSSHRWLRTRCRRKCSRRAHGPSANIRQAAGAARNPNTTSDGLHELLPPLPLLLRLLPLRIPDLVHVLHVFLEGLLALGQHLPVVEAALPLNGPVPLDAVGLCQL